MTGPAGGGKSTTLGRAFIDRINQTRRRAYHYIRGTIEYLHRNAKCAVSQREVGLDTESYLIRAEGQFAAGA